MGFTSAGQLHAQREEIILITTGSRELDKVLEGRFKWQFVTTVILFTIYTIRHRTQNCQCKSVRTLLQVIFCILYNVAWLEFDRRR